MGLFASAPLVGPRKIVQRLNEVTEPAYSVCVLVTRADQFEQMRESFVRGGFDPESCEYLVCDNTAGNRADAYVALNEFLQAAAAGRIILGHQDLVLLDDHRRHLDVRLDELGRIDPHWALAGNAGVTTDGLPQLCLPHDDLADAVLGGPFPQQVVSLDENFIVVRAEANLALSRDLSGFHHYGTDLCLIADVLGWNAWVIDFYLRHFGTGTVDESYFASARGIEAKYRRALRSRWVPNVINSPVFVSGSGRTLLVAARLLYDKLTGRAVRNRRAWSADRRSRREPLS